MDLNGIKTFVPLQDRGDLDLWTATSAWLAGGTWLFSEPQPCVDTLLDLSTLAWPSIRLTDSHLQIAATCTFADLSAYPVPAGLTGLNLIEPCCRALLGSFKIWNVATVGGNICLALPAAPMIALAVALEGAGVIWTRSGEERRVAILDFVVGASQTSLDPGEILRAIELPVAALRRRTTHRRASLTPLGRSAALLIGTREAATFALTITGAVRRPRRLDFAEPPSASQLRETIDAALAFADYHDDIHGRPAWRQHLTRMLAEEIRAELVER